MVAARFEFPNAMGEMLSARLERPPGEPIAYALFAHCFTCGKDNLAAARISQALTRRGFAVLRFDFTGLGGSEGDFANTNFSSNVADLVAAADELRRSWRAPSLLIGHSLGGAAVLAAAEKIPAARAVVTIAAPADVSHVKGLFADRLQAIERQGEAEVELAGRRFRVRREFFENLAEHRLLEHVAALHKALLILHSPADATVGVDNAGAIFTAAKHPKSFISLAGADHLLSRRPDAEYVADVIAAWVGRYLDAPAVHDDAAQPRSVLVAETGRGTFQQEITVGPHRLLADEPKPVGGLDSGLGPYDLLLAGLGACTSMTLRMYAQRKQLALDRVSVALSHSRIYAADCESCETKEGMLDRLERTITLEGSLDAAQCAKLLEIADKCPVHRTLKSEIDIRTRLADS